MRDACKREIKEGYTVVTTIDGYTYKLSMCLVIGFTAKKVKLLHSGITRYSDGSFTCWDTTIYKFPEQVAVVGTGPRQVGGPQWLPSSA